MPPSGSGDAGHPENQASIGQIRNFRLIEEIARGGMGVVYKAFQEGLGRMVAIKMIRGGRFADAAEVERFRAEAEAAAKLRHPGIVAIHQIGEEDGNHFFSMDLVEGGDLDAWLDGRPMNGSRAAELLRKITEALHYAHGEGIIHRDLKPHNILMDADGNPHVTDFGIAKRLDSDSQLTITGVVMGSPSYMSPEQASGDAGKVGETSDIYSLGAILYTLLTGRPPFQGATPMKTLEQVVSQDPVAPKILNPLISDDLNTICLKCLNKHPRSRYQSAAELMAELDRFTAGKPILARPIGRTEKALKWVRRNRMVSSLCGVIAGMVLVGFASVWWQLQKTEKALASAKELRRAESSARAAVLAPKQVLAHPQQALSVAFTPDGTRLLTASGDGQWRVFNGQDGSLQQTVEAHGGMIAEANYDRQGGRILTFSYDSQTHYPRMMPNGKPIKIYTSHAYGDQSAHLWDAATGTRLLTITNKTQMSAARLSPDEQWIAIATWSGLVEIYEVATGARRGSYQAHKAAVQGLEFSPDSTRLVTASEGTSYNMVLRPNGGGGSSSTENEKFLAHLLEVPTATPRLSLPNQTARGFKALLGGPSGSRCTARFSPDGSRLVTAGEQPENTCLWDATTGRVLARLDRHAHSVYRAVFSPNGQWIATGSGDNTAMIWRADTGEHRMTLRGHEEPVMWVEFSPDSRLLATGSGDGTARVWDVQQGICISVLKSHTKRVYQARFSPDGLRLATASKDGTACLWDAAPMEYLSRVYTNHDSVVLGISFSRDSQRFATRAHDGKVRVWDATNDGAARWTFAGAPEIEDDNLRNQVVDEALYARFNPAQNSLVTLNEESRADIDIKPILGMGGLKLDPPYAPLRVWNLDSGELTGSFPGMDKAIASVDISPDGRFLAAGQHDTLRFKSIYRSPLKSGSSGSSKRTENPTSVWIWDLKTGKEVRELKGHEGRIELVRFSPDGRSLVSADRGTTRLWNLETGGVQTQLEASSFASDGSFLDDGKRILLHRADTAGLWNLETGKREVRFSIHERLTDFRQCVLSPDATLVACRTSAETAYLCSTTSGEVVRELQGHRGKIWDVAFHPNGELLATASDDKRIHIWRVDSGELVRALEGHKEPVTSVAFSPDGKWLGSTSRDFTARLWPTSAF